MKSIIFALLCLFGLAAQAETTIALQPASCGAGVWCDTVPNDSTDKILLYGSTNYQDVGVIVTLPDGSQRSFQSINYRGYATIFNGTCPNAPLVGYFALGLKGNPVPMSGITGPATITAIFACTTNQGGSGRGNGPHQVWMLTAGTLTF